MPLINDTFTDTNGTNLSSHTGESGVTWATPSAFADGGSGLIYGNKVTKDALAASVAYFASVTPNPDCVITCVVHILSVLNMNAGVIFRAGTNGDHYIVRYNSGTSMWEVRSTLGGSAGAAFTNNTWAETLNAGDSRTLEVTVSGSSIVVKIDGVTRISGTNAALSSGNVGIRFSPTSASSTTGIAFDSFAVDNLSAVPNPPSNLNLSVISPTQINLSWVDNSSNETSFRVERKTGVGGAYAEAGSTSANLTTFEDTTVAASTTYFYRVKARNASGDSTYLTEQSASTPAAGAPSAPTNLILTGVSATQVDLSWTDTSATETGFKVERKTGAGGTYAEIVDLGANVTSYSDTAVTGGNSYFYRVKAYNVSGSSAYCPEQSITTASGLPLAPSNLSLLAVSGRQVDVQWTDNSNNETTFRIERKTGAAGTYLEIGFVGPDVTRYKDVLTSPNTTYFYRVRARNVAGNSAYTSEQSITTPSTVSIYLANLQHGEGTDGIYNPSRQVNILTPATDIICVQERTTGDNSWNSLLNPIGFQEAVYLENSPTQGDGPAIWYKSSTVTLNAFYSKKLSTGAVGWSGENVDKAAVAVKVTSGGKQFYVVSTHLAWSAGADAQGSQYSVIRVNQLKVLMDWIRTTLTGGLDIVLAGDMNLTPIMPREQTFTANSGSDIITSTNHQYVNGQPVTVRNTGGALPGNLAGSTTYYVRDVTTDTFRLAATLGGSAINLSSNGTGTNYVISTQIDIITGTYDDLWVTGINSGKATADWYDLDFNGVPDMPISNLGTRTHDTRRIDYFFLIKNSTSLSLRGIDLPELRIQCSTALEGSPPYCPDTAENQRSQVPEDTGVRPSDHNWLKLVLDTTGTGSGLIVDAGLDQVLSAGTTSTNLSASVTNPTNSAITVTWSRISGPNSPTISSPSSLTTGISGLTTGTYVFRCLVTNAENESHFDEVQVVVSSNQAPIVSAGINQTLPLGTSSTTLIGSVSDPDGQAVSVVWSRVSGPNVPTISSPSSLSTAVTGLIAGTYVFRLTASDGTLTSQAEVQVVIATTTATASLVVPATAYVGEVVVVDGSGSTGVNGQVGWSTKRFLDGSAPVDLNFGDNKGAYSKSSMLKSAHVYLAAGTYQVTLTVKDSSGVPVTATPQTIVVSEIPTASGGNLQTLTDQGSSADNMAALQTAVNTAFGNNITNHQEIRIPNTSIYSGAELNIPAAAGDKYVTIRPVDISWLPSGLKRVTPAMAVNMPKFLSPFNNASVIRMAGVGRKYLRVVGCEFKKPADAIMSSMLDIGTDGNTSPTAYNQLVHHVMYDRCYIHGNPNDDTDRGMLVHGNDISVLNCHFEDFHSAGNDSQAIVVLDGKRQGFVNNWFEGYGENLMWGGGGTKIKFSATSSNGTPTSCTLSSTTNLNVGDGISFVVENVRGPWTASIVRSISGNNITFDQITNQAGVPTAPSTTADSVRFGSSPQDIVVARNYLYKNQAYRVSSPNYNGHYTVVKNSFELKHAMRVRIVANIIENMWGGQGQDGQTVLFTPRNQTCYLLTTPYDPVTCPEQLNPWTMVRDVEFTYTKLKNISHFLNILGTDNLNPAGLGDESGPSSYTRNISVVHVLVEGGDPDGQRGQMMLIWPGCKDITVSHVTGTFVYSGSWITSGANAVGSVSSNVLVVNNIWPHQLYGMIGDGQMADNFVSTFFPDGYVNYNVLSDELNSIGPNGEQWSPPRAAPRYFIPTINTGTFINLAAGNLKLADTSPFKAGNATPAADGTDMGVDFDGLSVAISGVISGDWETGVNQPPVINAGLDRTLPGGTTSAILSGTASDPEGSTLTYNWSKISGPGSQTIVTPTSLSSNVTGLIAGTFVFRLTVSDGTNTVIDDVQIIVGTNTVPVVSAGTDQTLTASTTSTNLTGTASDPDGSIVSTLWTKVSGPACTITTPSTLSTSVTGMTVGTYVFRLTATDNVGGTNFDDIQVTISSNVIPIVSAGTDQNLTAVTTNTTLVGTASDPDGSIASTTWTKLSGPVCTIVSPNALTTNVTGLTPGVYTFRLTAIDNLGVSNTDDVLVRVNSLPSVDAGPDQTLATGSTSVTLSGTATDADGDTLTKTWSRVSGPNTPTIVSPNTLSTNVTGMVAGTYVFRLTVSDGINPNVTNDVQIVISTASNQPPVVNVGPDRKLPYKVSSTTLGAQVSDPESGSLTYTWTRVSGPNVPTIVTPNTASTAITGLVKGAYVFRLTVSDGTNSVSDDVRVEVPFRRGSVGGSITTGGIGGSIG
jgi:endonuclease/exonuclease/phosphatase family metal-dependent hydrolase